MKLVLEDKDIFVLRLDKGEELKQTLIDFCNDYNITTAHISGIGSTDDCTLAYYDTEKKEYIDHHFGGQHEVTNIIGNIAMYENKPIVHAHASISNYNLQTISGHVQKLVTCVTNEIVLTKLNGVIRRKHSPEDNLYLME